MGFRKYIIASILLVAIIAGYVASFNQADYTLQIVEIGFKQTLPMYIWIIVPAIVLFFATIFHMIYYGAKGYFQRRAIDNDLSKLTLIIKDRLLKKKSNLLLKTPALKEIGNILNKIDLNAKEIDTDSKEIKEAVKVINKIDNGEYISNKELKLSSDNPLFIKNIKNRIKKDDNFAIEVLKQSKSYDKELVSCAFFQVLENKSIATIKKVIEDVTLTKEMTKALLKKDSTSSKELAFSNSEILQYIQDVKFTNEELIEIAKNYKRIMSPEQIIKLFEDIAAYDESLSVSYLYILFEYQMIEQAREI